MRFILEKISQCRNIKSRILTRRIVKAFSFFVFLSLNAFLPAKENDVSLTFALNYNQTDYLYREKYYHSVQKNDFKLGIENYNLIFPSEVSSIGFFEGFSAAFTNNLALDLFFGPAFSFSFCDFFKIQGGPALLFSFCERNYSFSDGWQTSFGFLNALRLKIEPFKKGFARHIAFSAGVDFSWQFLCYQYEVTSSYKAF